jgi:retinoblastoma-like protein 1
MKFYRSQPQADSHIYRSVFIEYTDKERSSNVDAGNARSNAAEPEVVSGRSTIYGTESRGDIIYFYNKIFVPKMQAFAMSFSTSSQVILSLTIMSFSYAYLTFMTIALSHSRIISCYRHCLTHVH